MAVPLDDRAELVAGAVVRAGHRTNRARDLRRAPGLVDADVGDDVLEGVVASQIGPTHCAAAAAGDRRTEVVERTTAIRLDREGGRLSDISAYETDLAV
jgi:hypothetical protein